MAYCFEARLKLMVHLVARKTSPKAPFPSALTTSYPSASSGLRISSVNFFDPISAICDSFYILYTTIFQTPPSYSHIINHFLLVLLILGCLLFLSNCVFCVWYPCTCAPVVPEFPLSSCKFIFMNSLRDSTAFFTYYWCLWVRSLRMLRFFIMRVCESRWRCRSCWLRSRWMRFRRALRTETCCFFRLETRSYMV